MWIPKNLLYFYFIFAGMITWDQNRSLPRLLQFLLHSQRHRQYRNLHRNPLLYSAMIWKVIVQRISLEDKQHIKRPIHFRPTWKKIEPLQFRAIECYKCCSHWRLIIWNAAFQWRAEWWSWPRLARRRRRTRQANWNWSPRLSRSTLTDGPRLQNLYPGSFGQAQVCIFRPSAKKSGRPYGVMYLSSSWGPPPQTQTSPSLRPPTLTPDPRTRALGLYADKAYLFYWFRLQSLGMKPPYVCWPSVCFCSQCTGIFLAPGVCWTRSVILRGIHLSLYKTATLHVFSWMNESLSWMISWPRTVADCRRNVTCLVYFQVLCHILMLLRPELRKKTPHRKKLRTEKWVEACVTSVCLLQEIISVSIPGIQFDQSCLIFDGNLVCNCLALLDMTCNFCVHRRCVRSLRRVNVATVTTARICTGMCVICAAKPSSTPPTPRRGKNTNRCVFPMNPKMPRRARIFTFVFASRASFRSNNYRCHACHQDTVFLFYFFTSHWAQLWESSECKLATGSCLSRYELVFLWFCDATDTISLTRSQECIKQHEEDMELSFAIARSKDKSCGICMEVKKKFLRFHFCCVLSWTQQICVQILWCYLHSPLTVVFSYLQFVNVAWCARFLSWTVVVSSSPSSSCWSPNTDYSPPPQQAHATPFSVEEKRNWFAKLWTRPFRFAGQHAGKVQNNNQNQLHYIDWSITCLWKQQFLL